MDRYIVRDKGFEIVNQTTGEAFAVDEGRSWANLGYEGVVAMQKIWVDSIVALQSLGEANLANKAKKGK